MSPPPRAHLHVLKSCSLRTPAAACVSTGGRVLSGKVRLEGIGLEYAADEANQRFGYVAALFCATLAGCFSIAVRRKIKPAFLKVAPSSLEANWSRDWYVTSSDV